MFTGIITEIGTVRSASRSGGNVTLTIDAPATAAALRTGSSVAVNGACLTAVTVERGSFTADVVAETLTKTALGERTAGKPVNLELPLRVDALIDGHLVLGHVDATCHIEAIEERGESWWFSLRVPQPFLRYVVHTGSVAVDGVSLTVARIESDRIGISIIPHTMRSTIFGTYRTGDRVNLEVDVLGKYVERMLEAKGGVRAPGKLTVRGLEELGF